MPIAEDPEPRPARGDEPGGSDPSGTGEKDPFADLVLDEEFVRNASVKEQAGRTRMLSARWKHTPPVDPGGRRSVNDGPAPKRRFGRKPKPQPLDPWGNPRPRRRRFAWRTPLYVALTVAVLLAALNTGALRTWYADHLGGPSAAHTPVPTVAPETAKPTTAPPKVDEQQPTVDHPWAGSPAEGWPNGADAFVLPEAQATGVFSAEQVAAQLKSVKDYLIAANLDPKVIGGGRPDAALALLERQDQDGAKTALDHPTKENDPTSWFSRFDPRDAIPVGDTVKVQGRMTYEGDGDKGVLIHTDFSFVYALRPGPDAAKRAVSPQPTPGAPQPTKSAPAQGGGTARPVGLLTPSDDVAGDTWTTRTIVRRVDTFRFYDPARYQVQPKKIVYDKSQTDPANSACDVYDGYFHPQFDQFAALQQDTPGSRPTGPAIDPYDRSKDIQQTEECGTISRN
ncbi:hypothetical protein BX285_1617 [Streptomyces sp. 1114.5]|uniref:SCO2583/SCO2584 N-terminal domain-containing protein n=1 Tax=unclassified Streptomyces TaxID=2593676 RepID=UPI000BD9277D|nr:MULTISPECIES: hypothetical protein [unclassified Streptomyces]RKT17249.1 hypothetical protein BX285_1617 [Streptomyces sp. 1114.5]SOB83456.1 hypothetical protein SAMN06272789_3663 [Streptomyces sp. 1331.2]